MSNLVRLRGSGESSFDADWALTMAGDEYHVGHKSDEVAVRHLIISKTSQDQVSANHWLTFDRPHQRIGPIDRPETVDHGNT